MQAKKRYLLVLLSCAFLAYCYFGGYRLKSESEHPSQESKGLSSYLPSWPLWSSQYHAPELNLPSYLDSSDDIYDRDLAFSPHLRRSDSSNAGASLQRRRPCRMETCFDFSRCNSEDFKVYVYPPEDEDEEEDDEDNANALAEEEGDEGEEGRREDGAEEEAGDAGGAAGGANGRDDAPPASARRARQRRRRKVKRRPAGVPSYPRPSPTYSKILDSIVESRYFTADPSRACLFVLAVDTLDRDSLSQDFAPDVPNRLSRLPLWNNGRNHLVFNLYSGTWPHYAEPSEGPGGGGLGFDPGEAILARASASVDSLRPGFDVSLPLFHRSHPWRGGETPVNDRLFPVSKKFLLAFKGKRYVHGIGSDARNALHHLHNGRDVVLVTTCRHGKKWREMKDERCDEDNAEYDR
ncbi:hypothetical protein J437_LFUL003070 [Ladona fulva]|uniref:Exostosin GT47 domain-containing protein n=1 Tax=Ladona fulva TaxID=123851 RepID=A0A8K0JYI4_LADFU|nr:hypothetical protein J437_LFUL003070 [Ladona fulva]